MPQNVDEKHLLAYIKTVKKKLKTNMRTYEVLHGNIQLTTNLFSKRRTDGRED